MKTQYKLLTTILFLITSGYSKPTPCMDYTCDSLAVRAILDSNSLDTVPVTSVCSPDEGRLRDWDLRRMNITDLTHEIGALTRLDASKQSNYQNSV